MELYVFTSFVSLHEKLLERQTFQINKDAKTATPNHCRINIGIHYFALFKWIEQGHAFGDVWWSMTNDWFVAATFLTL